MSYGQELASSSRPKRPFRWHYYAEFNDSNFQIRGRTLFFIVVLLSVVLLLALLFLYARYVCRFSAAPPPPPPPPPARTSTRIPRRSGLDAAEISGLPTIVLHKGDRSAECCICLGVFDEGDQVKALPRCQHCFHSQCVDKWLTAQSSCPLCRAAVMADPPV